MAASYLRDTRHANGVHSPRIPENIRRLTTLPEPLAGVQENFSSVLSMFTAPPEIIVIALDGLFGDSETIFRELYGEEQHRFWLDSAKVEPGRSRFSYMGCPGGKYSFICQYSTATRCITIDQNCSPQLKLPSKKVNVPLPPRLSFFHFISAVMKAHGNGTLNSSCVQKWRFEEGRSSPLQKDQDFDLDFPFLGGLVGCFGYEMKIESMCFDMSTGRDCFQTASAGHVPDSAFMFADRFLVWDYEKKGIYAVAWKHPGSDLETEEVERWSKDIAASMRAVIAKGGQSTGFSSLDPSQARQLPLNLAHGRSKYLENIRTSLSRIRDGETYEVCLTTQIQGKLEQRPHDVMRRRIYEFYCHLRNRNAAPYASYMEFGDAANGLTIAGSSPERFLRCEEGGRVEMKPIKGTLARPTLDDFGGDIDAWRKEDERRKDALQANEKDRAENLMIVDLIRNDLNFICDPHTVSVPLLMKVESYATVHQLVTTVQGQLRPNLNCVDAIRATFPPGSMTGAPKLRTCQILEELEGMPRGPYSGCAGFISVTGAADMSVVIRTAIFHRSGPRDAEDSVNVDIGAGGAIVYLSDPVSEFDEMLLKGNSVLP
ncbi:hypothetical protein HDU96_001193, partial [Phlyctochytrium bullatum]